MQEIHKNMRRDAMHCAGRRFSRNCSLHEKFYSQKSVNFCQTTRRPMPSQPFAWPQINLTLFEVIFNVTIKCDVI
jgi:hypothetical protein